MSFTFLVLGLIIVCEPRNILTIKLRDVDPYLQIVSSGLSAIVWSADNDFNSHVTSLSSNCSSSLRYIHQGIHESGSSKAFELLDYSSKAPSGILDGTTASFGDYDGCLSLEFDRGHGLGQYCTVTMALTDPGNSSAIGSLYFKTLPYLGAFDLSFGLCFPSTCSKDEIETFILSRTSSYPLSLSSYKKLPLDFDTPLTCETYEETTWIHRLKNLTKSQIFSILWLLILPTLVVISSLLTLIGVKGRINNFAVQATIKNLLAYREPADTTLFLLDSLRAQVILGGFLAHALLPVEKLQAIQFLYSPDVWASYTSTWLLQPWNDGLLGFVPFFSGYACYKFFANKITTGSLNVFTSIFQRYVKIIIAVSIALSAEFIFPLLGDGPIFKMLSQRFIHDCDANWWRHFILDVHTPGTRSCAIHMFYGSMEVKLFILGLLALWICKGFNTKATLTIWTLITFASCFILHEQVKHLDMPTFLSSPADLKLISESFYTTHFVLNFYLPGFMVGLATGYVLENKILFYTPTPIKWFIHLIVSGIWGLVTLFAPGLHNILKIVPRSLFGSFIVAHRMMYFMMFAIDALHLTHYCGPINMSLDIMPKSIRMLFGYISKAAMSVHMVNLLYLRYYFLTMRQLQSIRPFDICMRWLFSAFFVLFISLLAEIFIFSPLKALSSKSKSSDQAKKDA